MLGLRRIKGVCWEEISIDLSDERKAKLKTTISLLQEQKLIIESNGILQLTPAGLTVENDIITRLSL